MQISLVALALVVLGTFVAGMVAAFYLTHKEASAYIEKQKKEYQNKKNNLDEDFAKKERDLEESQAKLERDENNLRNNYEIVMSHQKRLEDTAELLKLDIAKAKAVQEIARELFDSYTPSTQYIEEIEDTRDKATQVVLNAADRLELSAKQAVKEKQKVKVELENLDKARSMYLSERKETEAIVQQVRSEMDDILKRLIKTQKDNTNMLKDLKKKNDRNKKNKVLLADAEKTIAALQAKVDTLSTEESALEKISLITGYLDTKPIQIEGKTLSFHRLYSKARYHAEKEAID